MVNQDTFNYDELFNNIKNLVKLRRQQEETLKDLVKTLLRKKMGSCSMAEWEEAVEQTMYDLGLGPITWRIARKEKLNLIERNRGNDQGRPSTS